MPLGLRTRPTARDRSVPSAGTLSVCSPLRARSSVGQSRRLIIARSQVQVLAGPRICLSLQVPPGVRWFRGEVSPFEAGAVQVVTGVSGVSRFGLFWFKSWRAHSCVKDLTSHPVNPFVQVDWSRFGAGGMQAGSSVSVVSSLGLLWFRSWRAHSSVSCCESHPVNPLFEVNSSYVRGWRRAGACARADRCHSRGRLGLRLSPGSRPPRRPRRSWRDVPVRRTPHLRGVPRARRPR